MLDTAYYFAALGIIEVLLIKTINRTSSQSWRETFVSTVGMIGESLISKIPYAIILPISNQIYSHRLFTIDGETPISFLIAFLLADFIYYLRHALEHKVRWLWVTHSVHHNSSQISIAAGYRRSLVRNLNGGFIFVFPFIFIGVDPKALKILFTISGLYQVFVHTEWIPKFKPLEWVFNTPSAHRVHHASNPIYIDKNHGGILLIWDHIFGTYQEELKSEPCIYGLTKPIDGGNFWQVQTEAWFGLFRDLKSANNAREVLGYLFLAPGWSPKKADEKNSALGTLIQSTESS